MTVSFLNYMLKILCSFAIYFIQYFSTKNVAKYF